MGAVMTDIDQEMLSRFDESGYLVLSGVFDDCLLYTSDAADDS